MPILVMVKSKPALAFSVRALYFADKLSIWGRNRQLRVSMTVLKAEQPNPLTAEDCQTMADVREEIDRLDRELVMLLAERQTYIEAAARIKPTRDSVRDPARIEDVVTKVLEQAKVQGLSANIAEVVWRQLIETCINHELTHFDKK
jgi:isochorismate pyruvate lyase